MGDFLGAIIFVNDDLTPGVQVPLVRQLYITETVSLSEFKARLAADPNYPQIIHENNLRILVITDLSPRTDQADRQLADVVIFIKAGLATIISCKFGEPGQTFPVDKLTIFALLAHYPRWGYLPINTDGVQNNILVPMHHGFDRDNPYPYGTREHHHNQIPINANNTFPPYEFYIEGVPITFPPLSSLAQGNVLYWNGFNWVAGPVNLAGGSNYVFGTIPVSDLPLLAGDVTGAVNSNTVINIHGASVPVAGSLVTGNVLQVSGTSSLAYGPLNLSGGSNYVAGILPSSNLPNLAGDVSGAVDTNTVTAIQNNPITTDAPNNGDVLTWNGSAWLPQPGNQGASGTAGGDLAGVYPNPTVIKIQGFAVSSSSPINESVLIWNTGASQYDIRRLTEDDILPGFSISSFTGGQTTEIGTVISNPSFTASYSSTPSSAQITNTANINSPFILSSPFTNATISGNFQLNTAGNITFTLSAISGVTRTTTQNLSYLPRSFGGVGAVGAIGSSTTASGNNALLSTGDTLTSLGLHSSDVGQVYGPFNPNGQKVYLFLPQTATPHTFKDQNGFIFPMFINQIFFFVNQHGASVDMSLYESNNVLSTPFTITVVS